MGLEISNTFIVNASADRLWEVLVEQFTDVAGWVSGLDGSSANPKATHVPDGATTGGRVCEVPGLGFTDERFTVFDPDKWRFGYSVEAEKLPGFVRDMQNTWTLTPVGPDSTEVQQVLTAELDGVLGTLAKPMMAFRFRRLLADIRTDLTAYAETGQVSDKKARELAKAG